MDIFVFHNPLGQTLMQSGEIINGITNKTWIERYAESGEFTLVGPVSAGLREKLPIGAFISHMATDEIMIVENHEINDSQDEDAKITITGRGFETFLEQRVAGANRVLPTFLATGTTTPKFHVPANPVWEQIVYLINYHIQQDIQEDINNAIFNVTVQTLIPGLGAEVDRKVDVTDIYSIVLELLALENLGIKVVRPGAWSPLGADDPNVAMRVHKGANRTATVVFSYDTGQLVSADYLWSNKKLKNTAIVTSKYWEAVVNLGPVNYNRRMMHVVATDVDEDMDPTVALFSADTILPALAKRGTSALTAQKDIALTKAEVSKQNVDTEYRLHYFVGDIVSVVGSYNESTAMRITEFVEIEDENGTVAYPTLSLE